MKKQTRVTRQHTKTLPVPHPPIGTQEAIDSQELLDALYWMWDALERSSMGFFLIHQTYEDAKKGNPLTGDKVELGVRKNEWVSGGKRILDAFIKPTSETLTEAVYLYKKVNSKNVPVKIIIHIYEDSPCITSLDMIHYMYERWSVPNPYSEFIKIYG